MIPQAGLVEQRFQFGRAEGVERLASRGEVRLDRIAAELLIGFRLASPLCRAPAPASRPAATAPDSVRLSARSASFCACDWVSPQFLGGGLDVVRQLGVERFAFLEREVGVLLGTALGFRLGLLAFALLLLLLWPAGRWACASGATCRPRSMRAPQ